MRIRKFHFSHDSREKFFLFLPLLSLIAILSTYPILRGIYLGFTTYRVGRGSRFNGFDNYIRIYDSGYLVTSFQNIAFMLFVSIIVIYLISLSLALLLNEKIFFRSFWITILIIPWAVHPLAKITIWRTIFNPVSGYLNHYLLKLGIIEVPISWTSEPQFAIYTVICILIWGCVPFLSLSLLATLQQIPDDIKDAARLDGASDFQIFRHITIPYLNQTTAICISLIIVWIINDFASQFALTGGGPGTATLTPLVDAYVQGFRYGNLGFASAYGNMLILVVSIIIYFYIRTMNARSKELN